MRFQRHLNKDKLSRLIGLYELKKVDGSTLVDYDADEMWRKYSKEMGDLVNFTSVWLLASTNIILSNKSISNKYVVPYAQALKEIEEFRKHSSKLRENNLAKLALRDAAECIRRLRPEKGKTDDGKKIKLKWKEEIVVSYCPMEGINPDSQNMGTIPQFPRWLSLPISSRLVIEESSHFNLLVSFQNSLSAIMFPIDDSEEGEGDKSLSEIKKNREGNCPYMNQCMSGPHLDRFCPKELKITWKITKDCRKFDLFMSLFSELLVDKGAVLNDGFWHRLDIRSRCALMEMSKPRPDCSYVYLIFSIEDIPYIYDFLLENKLMSPSNNFKIAFEIRKGFWETFDIKKFKILLYRNKNNNIKIIPFLNRMGRGQLASTVEIYYVGLEEETEGIGEVVSSDYGSLIVVDRRSIIEVIVPKENSDKIFILYNRNSSTKKIVDMIEEFLLTGKHNGKEIKYLGGKKA